MEEEKAGGNKSILKGIAGEYFVAAELSKRGYIAAITLRNTESADVLCSDTNAKKQIAIQVKTNTETSRSWRLTDKAETLCADGLFYVFVALNEEGQYPDFFIVPSKDVADYCKKTHKQWLETPDKNGCQHKDSNIRKFNDKEGIYLGRWDLLGYEK